MIPIWTCYFTDIGVLYETVGMCDRGDQPHGQQQDLKLLMHYSLGEHWFVRIMVWTMIVSKCAMVQGQWYLCWYTTSQTLEGYMRYGQYFRGADNPIVNINTLNYTCFTPYCYTDYRHIELDLCPSIIVQWFKDNDTRTDMLLHTHWSVIWCMDNMWEGLTIPQTTSSFSTTHASLSGVTPLLSRNTSIYAHL